MASIIDEHPLPWAVVDIGTNRHGVPGARIQDSASRYFVDIRSPVALDVAWLIVDTALLKEAAQFAGYPVTPGETSGGETQTVEVDFDKPFPDTDGHLPLSEQEA